MNAFPRNFQKKNILLKVDNSDVANIKEKISKL